ncbi:Commissureless [Popillia japonica]|uniref:Commissureless n=1 Tax=Popillia japonica TaxID=7064 RepID=A0AAW1KN96_POPJA
METKWWVGIVLTLMVLCCVCCMCSCLLYHKFQQWKRSVEERRREDLEAANAENESLPSYTIVSGLPSFPAELYDSFRSAELR